MIVIDTSALMSICLDEATADDCTQVIRNETNLLISAGTVAESFVVALGRNVTLGMERLIEGLDAEIVPITADTARHVGDAYRLWGKGRHPAGLNLGDCFAYALARERGCPLLFIGNDFSRTDITGALSREG